MRVKKAYKIVLKDIKENAPRYMVGKVETVDERFMAGIRAVLDWISISANESLECFRYNERGKEDE